MLKISTFALSIVLVTGCTTQSVPKDTLTTSAVISSGSTNIWSVTSGGPKVSIVSVDGNAVENIYGPVILSPGKHIIEMACSNNKNKFEVSVMSGEEYEFTVGYGRGQPGCLGGLLKVN